MLLDPRRANTFYAALQAAGMPDVPGEFSVVPQHQVIPAAILAEISDFIHTFDRVTGRMAWQGVALREAPVIAQLRRPEVCFFSAWDFHLPPQGGCLLIEFNDNGSGFLSAAIINALYREVAGLGQERQIAAPAGLPAFEQHIADLIEREAKTFFGEGLAGLFFVLDDADSLEQGKFRRELEPGALGKAFGGPAGRRTKRDLHGLRAQDLENGVDQSGLADTVGQESFDNRSTRLPRRKPGSIVPLHELVVVRKLLQFA